MLSSVKTLVTMDGSNKAERFVMDGCRRVPSDNGAPTNAGRRDDDEIEVLGKACDETANSTSTSRRM